MCAAHNIIKSWTSWIQKRATEMRTVAEEKKQQAHEKNATNLAQNDILNKVIST